MKHTLEELRALQALPLERKILVSQTRIIEWYRKYKGNVCVSYSGGKDSTVLLHLVRTMYPEVPAVYCDTRLDYPEVREHVKATENVIWLKPDKSFREVIDEYGWCYPSKEIAAIVEGCHNGRQSCINRINGLKSNGESSDIGFYQSVAKWKWLLDIDVKISAKCCYYMKEYPFTKFQRKTGKGVYVGTLASESLKRRYAWYQVGCNNVKTGKSKPLSFWTEQDILQYVIDFDLKIPSVYGSIIADKHGKLKATGMSRTGCVFCPIGAHLEKFNRFQRLKETHPHLYKYCMNELGLKQFLDSVHVDY